MPFTTPARVRRESFRVLAVTAPLTLVALLLWAWMPDWLPERPTLWFAVYQLLLLLSLGAALAAVISSGQLAIAKAFAAGYNTGLAAAQRHDGDDSGPHLAPLRVVE